MGQKVKALHYYFRIPGQESPHVVTTAQDFTQALAFARNLHPQAQYLQRVVICEEVEMPVTNPPVQGVQSHVEPLS